MVVPSRLDGPNPGIIHAGHAIQQLDNAFGTCTGTRLPGTGMTTPTRRLARERTEPDRLIRLAEEWQE
jgi:hypothetical protein